MPLCVPGFSYTKLRARNREVADLRAILKLKPEEDVVDGLPNVCAQMHHFAVDAMQQRLQVVALAGILAVKQVQHLHWIVSSWKS